MRVRTWTTRVNLGSGSSRESRNSPDQRAAITSSRRALAIAKSFVEPFKQILRRLGDDRAGRKYGVGARLSKRREVLRRDDAADDDHRVPEPQLTKRFFQSRDEREMAGGQ